MSGIIGGLSTGFAAAGFLKNLLGAPVNPRIIIYQAVDAQGNPITNADGGPASPQAFAVYVPIREQHHDEMTITDHPVEQGAVISDHAYRLPALPRFRFGWSATEAASAANLSAYGVTLPTFSGLWAGDNSASYLQGLYAQLLNLMATKTLLTIVTGKRAYNNLLILSIDELTDETTENALMLDITCKQIIMVSTATVTVPINTSAQGNPQANTPPVNSGNKQLQPGSEFNANSGNISP
jgi:hypothetical protein